MTANHNLVAIRNNSTTRFFLDADGDSHQDVGTAWTTFDEHDDAEVLEALVLSVARPDEYVRRDFGEFLRVNKEKLEAMKLVSFPERGSPFVNMSKLTMLLVGAARQNAARISQLERNLKRLEADNGI